MNLSDNNHGSFESSRIREKLLGFLRKEDGEGSTGTGTSSEKEGFYDSEEFKEAVKRESLKVAKEYLKSDELKEIIKNETGNSIKEYSKSNDFKTDVKDIVNGVEEKLDKKIDDSKTRLVETLGIFVALFTFISVNINIFRKTKDLFAASVFMVLMALTIIFFMSPLLLLVQKDEINNKVCFLKFIFFGSAILLFTILVVARYINIPLDFN